MFCFIHVVLFYREDDTDIIKSSLYFLNTVLSKAKEYDEDFFVNVIKLVLCALSRKSFSQEIKNKVTSNLEEFLCQISHRIFRNKEFSALNRQPMQSEVQVQNACICIYVGMYVYVYN